MKMIIDTDPGVDDAIAIALALALPDVELLALTTVFGNTFVSQSSRNARYLLNLFGSDAPVAEGAALPYGKTEYAPSAHVHGPEGLGDIAIVPDIGQNAKETAAEFLVRSAEENKGELVVCAIGPLTNIADAIKLSPDFVNNVKELVIMGGAFECAGNVTPHAEANIYHDALAADAVFASGMNTTMVGLNATLQTLLTPDDFEELAISSTTTGGFIRDISKFYLGFYRSVGITEGCPMHDALAVLACVAPERFELKKVGLKASLLSENYGATVADHSRSSVSVALGVDADWALSLMKARIAERA